MDLEIPYLVEVVAFLLTVVVIVPVFKKFKVSPVLGYLAVGAALGPHSLAVVRDVDGVTHVAELGVIFLLFTIGLELSFERLRAFSRLIFGLGSVQVLLTAVAIGSIAFAWGNSVEAAIVLGLCLALSSTAMVMQILSERGELATPHGRTAFAVLLLQDLAVVPILILLPVLSGATSNVWLAVGLALLKAVITVGLIVLLGRFALRYMFRTASATRSVDVFTAMMLLTILATSSATGLAGLSMELGAFLAGLLLAETEFRHQIESEIEPFKGLLLGLFFMSVGMSLDFGMAFDSGIWVVLAVLGLLVLKAAIATVSARWYGLSWPVAARSGLLLAEAGEFAFVVIGQATLAYGLLDIRTGQFMVVVAGLSMAMTPALAALGKWLHGVMSHQQEVASAPAGIEQVRAHVIIAGYGRVGQAVAGVLRAQAIPFVAMDTSAALVKPFHDAHEPVFVGDAARAEVLKKAGIERASAVLITMDNASAAKGAVQAIRHDWPNLPILVRSRDAEHAQELLRLGANTVVPETFEASLQLSAQVLCALGYPRDDANACIDLVRLHNYGELRPRSS